MPACYADRSHDPHRERVSSLMIELSELGGVRGPANRAVPTRCRVKRAIEE